MVKEITVYLDRFFSHGRTNYILEFFCKTMIQITFNSMCANLFMNQITKRKGEKKSLNQAHENDMRRTNQY